MQAGLLQGSRVGSCSAAQQNHHLAAEESGVSVLPRVECLCSDQSHELHINNANELVLSGVQPGAVASKLADVASR